MIIDADVHISPFTEPGRIQVEELLLRMERAGVDRALAWLQPHYFRDMDLGNRYIFESVKRFPDSILGFGWVDPHYGVEKAREVVRRCIDEYGFYGVKLNGAQNEFYIDSDISLPVIEEIARTGKILAFHIGTDAYESTHPFRLGKIAAQFPETPILAVHMGGVAMNDLTNAMIEVAALHSNITLIGSAVKTRAIVKAIKTLGANRVCFGSDTPFDPMHVEVARYFAILSDLVTELDKNAVMGENIGRLFGLIK
jgi:uncharacterized protein